MTVRSLKAVTKQIAIMQIVTFEKEDATSEVEEIEGTISFKLVETLDLFTLLDNKTSLNKKLIANRGYLQLRELALNI
jgi:hypothetical protein